jgi:para-nitrobenzyl esterase
MEMPVAHTEYGQLQGISVSPEVWGFLGIPYAAPPVGSLRWCPTEPPAAWAGVRQAAAFGADPIQPSSMRVSRAPGMSEDCLCLNVWAPKERREGGWPVLVWACGGAFTTGGGAFAEEDPAKLAAKGAVVVSFNIRLNVFGFFAHAALSAETPHGSSGNYGLHDQAAALEWVRKNIDALNGDSRRITFFGESAGATCSMLLLNSPIKQNLFDRAILQSPGSFSALLPLAEAERHGAALGDTVEELRDIPSGELLERVRQLPAVKPSLWLARPLRPIVDGWLITSATPMAAGNFKAVPAIIGTNEDEGRFFGPRMGVKTVEDYLSFISSIFGDRADEALRRYPVASEADVAAMFSDVFGDRAFNYPINDLVQAFAESGADLFRYVYAYQPGETNRPPTHSEETAVLMDVSPHIRAEDAEMADMMACYWINFAENGDPNGSGLPKWPKHEVETHQYLRLDVPASAASHWRADQIAFMSDCVSAQI